MRKCVSVLITVLMVFSIAAVAIAETKASWTDVSSSYENLAEGQRVFRLSADVPANKTLKAYSFIVTYDETKVAVDKVAAAPDAAIAPANINTADKGTVSVNGFDIKGVEGKEGTKVSFIDVTVKGADASGLSVVFTAYGASSEDQFRPEMK